MRGKSKCKILKEIRRRIAEENEITYVTSECKFQGECRGTCPKCEQELRDLERQLERRQRLGKAVSVSALTAGLLLSAVGCPATTSPTTQQASGSEQATETLETFLSEPTEAVTEMLLGEVAAEENTDDTVWMGAAPIDSETPDLEYSEVIAGVPLFEENDPAEDDWELTGDFAVVEEPTENHG